MTQPGGYTVDPQALLAIADALRKGADEIQTQITMIKSQVDGMDGSWTGAAKQQFDELFMNWHRANQDNANALITYAEGVAKAANQYATAEQMNKDLLSGY